MCHALAEQKLSFTRILILILLLILNLLLFVCLSDARQWLMLMNAILTRFPSRRPA